MTRSERMLLLALFRWARAEPDVQFGRTYWVRRVGEPEKQWGIDFYPDDFDSTARAVPLIIWRHRIAANRYWVASIAEAVDLLVTLGIAPARFSTAYRAGYNAAMQAARIASSGIPARGWTCPEVYALLPWADTELVRQP